MSHAVPSPLSSYQQAMRRIGVSYLPNNFMKCFPAPLMPHRPENLD